MVFLYHGEWRCALSECWACVCVMIGRLSLTDATRLVSDRPKYPHGSGGGFSCSRQPRRLVPVFPWKICGLLSRVLIHVGTRSWCKSLRAPPHVNVERCMQFSSAFRARTGTCIRGPADTIGDWPVTGCDWAQECCGDVKMHLLWVAPQLKVGRQTRQSRPLPLWRADRHAQSQRSHSTQGAEDSLASSSPCPAALGPTAG